MPYPVTITKAEFDQFWSDVLGDNWAMEDDDIPDDVWESEDPATVMTFHDGYVYWQGTGTPESTAWFTAREIRAGLSFPALVARWRKRRQVVSVVAEIPRDALDEVRALIGRAGGTVISPKG